MTCTLTCGFSTLVLLIAPTGVALGNGQERPPPGEGTLSHGLDQPTVMVEMQILQVDPQAIQTDDDATGVADPLPLITGRGLQRRSGGDLVTIVPPELVIEMGEHKLFYRDGKLVTDEPPDSDKEAPSAPWKVLAAPRIVVYIGQEATVTVGRLVPYMVKREDGSLVLEHSEEVTEGVAVRTRVEQDDDGMFLLKDTSVKISRVTGRVPIEGVPFDVGRPIITSREITTTQKLAPDGVSVTRLARQRDDDPIILVFLSVKQAKP